MLLMGTHEPILVGLSITIAVVASYTGLDLADRAREAGGRVRNLWLLAAATTLGGGIWSMHFVAMLAFKMPGMSVGYDLSLTLFSFLLAVVFTGVGFALMGRRPNALRLAAAGLLMGFGIVAMHYVGMAAMRMQADISYDGGWVALSVLIAICAALAALWLASRQRKLARRITAAFLMGLAIAGMHYASMHGARFTLHPHAILTSRTPVVTQSSLANAVSGLTFLILAFALGAATIDRRLAAAARREARIALRLRLADVMRDVGTEEALRETAMLMGEHFGVDRVGYGELDAAVNQFNYTICWTNGAVPSLFGPYPAQAFGMKIVTALTAGETVAVDDLLTSELSDERQTLETAAEVDTRAILVVPFLREGGLCDIVYLNSRTARRWTSDEVMFMQEIAERTRQIIARAIAEEKLKELNETLEQRVQEAVSARELLAAVVDNTSASVMVCDRDLNILAMNSAQARDFERLYGRPCRPEDNLLSLLSVFPEHREMIHAQWRRALNGETFVIVDEFGDGEVEKAYFEVHFHPMRDAVGTVTGAFLTAYDVSERVVAQKALEAAQEALRQSQKMEAMGQLTGGVAHDFNNLLTPILGALDMLQRRGVGTEREQRLIAGAFQSADRAKILVQRLLAFARRQPLQSVPVNIGRLVTGMAELVTSTTGPQIKVSVDVPADLPPAMADPNQLEMALLNLSVNARDAMPDGGSLRISASFKLVPHDDGTIRAGRYICLSVADTGTGMDKETLAHAIEPFFSTKGVGRGTGLGLSMVHGLMMQLGGSLQIESYRGLGTNVQLWLPESHLVEEQVEVAGLVSKSLRRGTALLVDDEEYVRMSTADMLNDLGYIVIEATSAEEAISLLERGEEFDLLLTDHLMPGLTGTELVRHVRSIRPDIPALLVSGYADIEGVDADIPRLIKPFRKDELAASLAEI